MALTLNELNTRIFAHVIVNKKILIIWLSRPIVSYLFQKRAISLTNYAYTRLIL